MRSLVRMLFLGRLDVAERLAAAFEEAWDRARRRKPIRIYGGDDGGCGCKARQQRLNELLPFRDSHAN